MKSPLLHDFIMIRTDEGSDINKIKLNAKYLEFGVAKYLNHLDTAEARFWEQKILTQVLKYDCNERMTILELQSLISSTLDSKKIFI